jgi:hypothetical protein
MCDVRGSSAQAGESAAIAFSVADAETSQRLRGLKKSQLSDGEVEPHGARWAW